MWVYMRVPIHIAKRTVTEGYRAEHAPLGTQRGCLWQISSMVKANIQLS